MLKSAHLCLGAMYFGTRNDEATSFRLLDQYVEAAARSSIPPIFTPTGSGGYQGGESEALLGRWMISRRNRSNLFIATKVGFEIQARGFPAASAPIGSPPNARRV